MKQLLITFLIGISCLLYACGGQEISPPQETATQPIETAETHLNLGNTYLQQDQFGEAIAAYWKAIDIDPNNPHAYRHLGDAYFKRRTFEKAIEAYKRAIRIAPNDEGHNISTFLNVGIAYESLGRKIEAIIHYQEVFRLGRSLNAQNFAHGFIREAERRIRTLNEVQTLKPIRRIRETLR